MVILSGLRVGFKFSKFFFILTVIPFCDTLMSEHQKGMRQSGERKTAGIDQIQRHREKKGIAAVLHHIISIWYLFFNEF